MENSNKHSNQHRVIIFWLTAVIFIYVPSVAQTAIEIIRTIIQVLSNAKSVAGIFLAVIFYFSLSFLSGDLYFKKGKLKIKDGKEDANNRQHLA